MVPKSKTVSKKPEIRRVTLERSDNGGFISRVEHKAPERKSNGPWIEPKEEKNVHVNLDAFIAHLKQMFPPEGKKPASKPSSQWSDVGNRMLGMK